MLAPKEMDVHPAASAPAGLGPRKCRVGSESGDFGLRLKVWGQFGGAVPKQRAACALDGPCGSLNMLFSML